MIFVDASVFIAYANLDDVHHNRALAFIQDIEQGKYGTPITSDYVFQEIVGVTLRKQGKEKSIQIGNYLLRSALLIVLDNASLAEAWKIFVKTELELNPVDCASIMSMRLAGVTDIATFDQEFKKVKGITVVGA